MWAAWKAARSNVQHGRAQGRTAQDAGKAGLWGVLVAAVGLVIVSGFGALLRGEED